MELLEFISYKNILEKKKTIFEILDRKVELVMKMWNEQPLTPLSLEFNLHFCGLIKIF